MQGIWSGWIYMGGCLNVVYHTGFPNNQFRIQQHPLCLRKGILEFFKEKLVGQVPHLEGGLVYGSDGGNHHGGEGYVIEPYNNHIFRHIFPHIIYGADSTRSQDVRNCEYGIGLLVVGK